MADTILKYVADGYVATDYTEEYTAFEGASVKLGSFTITAEAYVDQGGGYVINDYVDPNYVGYTQALAGLNSEFQTQIQSLRLRPGDSTLAAESTLSSTALRLRDALADLSLVAALTADGDSISSGILTATSTSQITADADVIRYGSSIDFGLFTVQAQGGIISDSGADLTAFNTALYAGTRMRFADSAMTATTQSTQSGGIIKQGTNGIVSWPEIPVTGIHVNEDDVTVNYYPGTDPDPETLQEGVFSVWARADDGLASGLTGGTIFSARGDQSNTESAFRFRLLPATFEVSYYYSAGVTGGWSTTLSFSGVNIKEWHHYWITIQRQIIAGPLFQYTIKLYIDGVLKDTNTETRSTLDVKINAVSPASVGVNRVLNNYSDRFEGTLAQLWFAETYVGFGMAVDTVNEFYNGGWVDLGTDGTAGGTVQQPVYYEPFDYPYTTRTGGADATNYPVELLNPAPAIFTVSAIGDNVIGGAVTMSSAFTSTADGLKVQAGACDLNSESNLTATALRIHSGVASLNTAFTLTPAPTSELSAEASLEAFAFSIVIATTELLGQATMAVSTSVTATAYDFTKAEATLSALASTNLVANALIPEKGNVVTQANFTADITGHAVRGDNPTLQAESNLTSTALRIFDGVISMSALAFAISAGRKIEFNDNYTLIVARESGVLLVNSENRLFEVARETRINTVQNETRITQVEAETGLLLVDEEQ